MRSQSLADVWKQRQIPVVLRRNGQGEKIRIRLPDSVDNHAWLKNNRKISPAWIGGSLDYWELPKKWFDDCVNRCLERYGRIYIIQPYSEQEKCSPSCQNAVGHECQCSCMGEHHGAGNGGSWFEVSETFACRWGEKQLASRLLKAKAAKCGPWPKSPTNSSTK